MAREWSQREPILSIGIPHFVPMKHLLLLLVLGGERCAKIGAFAAPNSKLEAAAIRRFQQYDKLCKTCPTLLKPRVETLTEMIVGLTDEERDELWSNVASRLEARQQVEEQDGNHPGATTPEQVYKFQTGVYPSSIPRETKTTATAMESTLAVREPLNLVDNDDTIKLVRKMSKMRLKLQEIKAKRHRIQRLIHQTQSLLSNRPPSLNDMDETDSEIYHSIDKLQTLSPRDLKYAELKYIAQRSKTEQKISKYRLKLYGISMALAKKEQAQELLTR